MGIYATVKNYIEVLKPRETILLTFIGVCATIVADNGQPYLPTLLLVLMTILLLSAGVNGLTNYLDRNIDARMQRTCRRVLASKRIQPAEKALVWTAGLTAVGLAMAGWLNPFCLIAGILGTVAALVWRKKATCVFPQGMVASCAPVLMGWLAVKPFFSWELLLLCLLIGAWLPLHVWSVMIAHREDYIQAGLTYFPMSRPPDQAIRVLVLFSLVLSAASVALYFIGGFSLLYLVTASLLSMVMVYASLRLLVSATSQTAWKLYKLSAFPYLGLVFLMMVLDTWLK